MISTLNASARGGTCSTSQPTRMAFFQTPRRRCRSSSFALGRRASRSARYQSRTQQDRLICKSAIEEVQGSFVATGKSRPKGICHFLGGAFAGATPQLTYELLISLITDAGYTVIATPYAVTFQHAPCAGEVHTKFTDTILALRQSGRGWAVPEDAPIFGIGHSNGALLHLLIGSLYPVQNRSNVIISFNNKQVKDAIPLPLDGVQAVVQMARSSDMFSSLPSSFELLQRAAAMAPTGFPFDQRSLTSLSPAFDQLNSVFGEVGNGTVEFTPTPSESRQLIAAQYRVPQTLLVQFQDDNTDETNQMAPVLKRKFPQGTRQLTLPGTHVTPCGPNFRYQVGKSFSPVDAVALGVRMATEADIRRMSGRLIDWLDSTS